MVENHMYSFGSSKQNQLQIQRLEDYGLSQKDMYDLSTHVEEDY
jgi:hypothetical protein